eukprot:12450589-Alexandrium_andersonii.AAC.1
MTSPSRADGMKYTYHVAVATPATESMLPASMPSMAWTLKASSEMLLKLPRGWGKCPTSCAAT